MNIEVAASCGVISCSDMIGYQPFGGPCCFHLHYAWHHNPEDQKLDGRGFSLWLCM